MYIALTRNIARVQCYQLLKDLDRDFKLNIEFNDTYLEAKFPNESIIYCTGADVDRRALEKIRGNQFDLVVIDESQSFRNNLEYLIREIIAPTLWDRLGTLCCTGTPGLSKSHYFYTLTENPPKLWSAHRWNASDNPHIAKQFKVEVNNYLLNDPLFLQTPKFKREFLGEWVSDDTKLIYHYEESRNALKELPPADYNYVLGVDLGFNDDTAYVLCAYNINDPNLYVLKAEKQKKQDLFDVASRMKDYMEDFKLRTIVIDGSNKQAVETFQRRHNIPLITADKTGKMEHIDLLNTDLMRGRIKIHEELAMPLIEEMADLIYDDTDPYKRKELASCPNHLCDSFLYAWRYCYNYIAKLDNKQTSILEDPYENEIFEKFVSRMKKDDDFFDI